MSNEDSLNKLLKTTFLHTADEVTKVVILIDDQKIDELIEVLKGLKNFEIQKTITELILLSKKMNPYLTLTQTFGPSKISLE